MSEEMSSVFGGTGVHPLTANKVNQAIRDVDAKHILKYRIVLANILKYIIPEYRDLSTEKIAEQIPKSTLPDGDLFVREENPEDLEDHKHIIFDLLFSLRDNNGAAVAVWCDLEAQKQYEKRTSRSTNSYDLSARGVYYLSRMISRQIQSRKDCSNYNNLRKCYSIWICFDQLNSKEWEPKITKYRFTPVIEEGTTQPPDQECAAADLMELVIIRAGGKGCTDNTLIDFVNALWRDTDRLTYYIPKTYEGYQNIKEEAERMCSMREVGRAEGIAEGRVEGRAEGRAEGIVKTGIKCNLSKEQILQYLVEELNITKEEAETYYNTYSGS